MDLSQQFRIHREHTRKATLRQQEQGMVCQPIISSIPTEFLIIIMGICLPQCRISMAIMEQNGKMVWQAHNPMTREMR